MGERRREGMQKHKIWQKIIFQSAQEYSDYSQDFAFSKQVKVTSKKTKHVSHYKKSTWNEKEK